MPAPASAASDFRRHSWHGACSVIPRAFTISGRHHERQSTTAENDQRPGAGAGLPVARRRGFRRVPCRQRRPAGTVPAAGALGRPAPPLAGSGLQRQHFGGRDRCPHASGRLPPAGGLRTAAGPALRQPCQHHGALPGSARLAPAVAGRHPGPHRGAGGTPGFARRQHPRRAPCHAPAARCRQPAAGSGATGPGRGPADAHGGDRRQRHRAGPGATGAAGTPGAAGHAAGRRQRHQHRHGRRGTRRRRPARQGPAHADRVRARRAAAPDLPRRRPGRAPRRRDGRCMHRSRCRWARPWTPPSSRCTSWAPRPSWARSTSS